LFMDLKNRLTDSKKYPRGFQKKNHVFKKNTQTDSKKCSRGSRNTSWIQKNVYSYFRFVHVRIHEQLSFMFLFSFLSNFYVSFHIKNRSHNLKKCSWIPKNC
jgi:uncharacterized protein YifE (UPF0438 family)